MPAVKPGDKVITSSSQLSARYGQPIMGVDGNDEAQFLSTGSDGKLNVSSELKYQDINDDSLNSITVQNPLPTDGDSVYEKDIWLDQSTSVGFTGGNVIDLFNDLHTEIKNETSDNPKTVFIHFNRTVISNAVGLGCTSGGDFSNVKIEIVNSGHVYTTVIDESTSNTKYTTRTFQLPVTAGFNAIRVTFHTTDSICLTNCVILKSRSVVARLQAAKPDNTIIDINATTAGNLKTSLEEFESNISTNNNTQLRVTQYDSSGQEALYKNGLAKNTICDSVITSRCGAVAPNRAMNVVTATRLVGTAFDGTTLDTNFWTSTVTNGGIVTINGEAELDTNTTANGTVKLVSVRKARFVVSNPMEVKLTVEFHSVGDADNLRRIGAYDDNNGFFVQLDGDVFSFGIRTNKSGSPVDTLVSSGDFNGDVTTYSPGTARHKMFIQYTSKGAYLVIDGVFIHKISINHENQPTTYTLPITMENINDNNNDTNNELHVIGAVINRLGELRTLGTYKFINTNTTTVCKYTAGTLRSIINCDNAGSITIYDNSAASGTIIAIIDTAKVLGSLLFDVGFSNGLTIVTATGAKIAVVYE